MEKIVFTLSNSQSTYIMPLAMFPMAPSKLNKLVKLFDYFCVDKKFIQDLVEKLELLLPVWEINTSNYVCVSRNVCRQQGCTEDYIDFLFEGYDINSSNYYRFDGSFNGCGHARCNGENKKFFAQLNSNINKLKSYKTKF